MRRRNGESPPGRSGRQDGVRETWERRSGSSQPVLRLCAAVLLDEDRLGVLDGIVQWCVIRVLGEAGE